jgi:hypothetical protein
MAAKMMVYHGCRMEPGIVVSQMAHVERVAAVTPAAAASVRGA